MKEKINYLAYKNQIVLVPAIEHSLATVDPEDLGAYRLYEKAIACRKNYFTLPRKRDSICDRAVCQATVDILGLMACQCKQKYYLYCDFFFNNNN